MKKVVALLLMVVMLVSIFTGCATIKGLFEGKSVIEKSSEAMEALKSFTMDMSADFSIDISKNGAKVSVPVKANILFDLVKDPIAVKMGLNLEMMNNSQKQSIIVVKESDGKIYTYTEVPDANTYVREEAKSQDMKEDEVKKISDDLVGEIKGWEWKQEEKDGFYVLSHTTTKEENQKIMDILNSLNVQDIAEGALEGNTNMQSFNYPLSLELKINKSTYYIEEVRVDMTEAVKAAITDSMGSVEAGEVSISNAILVLSFKNFDNVKVEAPEKWENSDDPQVDPTNTSDKSYSETLNMFVSTMQTQLTQSDPDTIYKVYADGDNVVLELSREGLEDYLNSDDFDYNSFKSLEENLLTGIIPEQLMVAMKGVNLNMSDLYIYIVGDKDSSKVFGTSVNGEITYRYTEDPNYFLTPAEPTETTSTESREADPTPDFGSYPLGLADIPFSINGSEFNFNSITPEDLEAIGFKKSNYSDKIGNLDAYDMIYLYYEKDGHSTVTFAYENPGSSTIAFSEAKLASLTVETGTWLGEGSLYGGTFNFQGVTTGMSYEQASAILGEGNLDYESDEYNKKKYSWDLGESERVIISFANTVGAYDMVFYCFR